MADPDVTAPKPVVFKARGVEIDTRLKVFDTVFHVSSTILKMHSQYFFKFLDSADKVIGTGHGDFKYDWVTKIVDDGKDWQLVAAGTSAGDLNLSEWKGGDAYTSLQQTAFHNILKAMYMLPYVLGYVQDLLDMTSLARFYMCLPLVSRTLDGAMARSHNLCQIQLKRRCLELLSAATELRHKALFKDSLIYCLGPFSIPCFTGMTDKRLERLARSHYLKLKSKAFDCIYGSLYSWCHEGVYNDDSVAANDPSGDKTSAWFKRGLALEKNNMEHGHDVSLPRMLRGMLEDEEIYDDFILEGFRRLMRNDLTIGRSTSEEAGKGNYEEYFLISTIQNDEDFPWDMAVDDW